MKQSCVILNSAENKYQRKREFHIHKYKLKNNETAGQRVKQKDCARKKTKKLSGTYFKVNFCLTNTRAEN